MNTTTPTHQQKLNLHKCARPLIVMVFCSLFLFYKYVLQVSPSVMTEQLMRHFHVHGFGLGNLAATFFYSYLVAQFFVGPLLDKYNPKILTALAIMVSGIGALIFANANSLAMAMLGRSIVGIGAAFATVSYFKMASLWFRPKHFALVGGLLATAAMVGSMAGQLPLAYLVEMTGWRYSLQVCGLLGLALGLFFLLLVPHHRQSNVTTHVDSKQPKLKDFLTLLKKKHNWLLTFYSGLAFSPVAVFGGLWGNAFLQTAYHVSKPTAASLTSLMFLGLAVGGPTLGFISDYFNKRFAVMLYGLLLSLCCLSGALYLAQLPLWFEGSLLFLFGFGTGAFMLGFTMGKELNPLPLAASVVGLVNTGDALFGAFSEPVTGKLLDLFNTNSSMQASFSTTDYHLALSILPLYLILAMVMLQLMKKTT